MNDTRSRASRSTDTSRLDGEPIYGPDVDPSRADAPVARMAMVFQRSNPFPKSIFENVAYGLRIGGVHEHRRLAERVERALRHAALWDEVSGLGSRSRASELSGGQQQRMCIARALAVEPGRCS